MKIRQAGKVLALVAGGCLFSLQAQSALVAVGSDGSGQPVGTPFGEPSGGVTQPGFTGTMYLEVFDSGGGTFSRTGDTVMTTGGDYTYVFQFALDADLGTGDGQAIVDRIDFSAFMLGTGDSGTPAFSFSPGPTAGGAFGTSADPAFTGNSTTATFTFSSSAAVSEGSTSAAFWFTHPELDVTAGGTTLFALGDRLHFTAETTVASSVNADIQVIPLPAAVWLFGSGLLGLAGMAKRKRC